MPVRKLKSGGFRYGTTGKIYKSKAKAEAQGLQQQTLTELMIKKMWIEKWNGELPKTSAGDSQFLIDLN